MTLHRQNMLFANECLQIAGSLILSFQSKANILNVIIKMYENTPVEFFLKAENVKDSSIAQECSSQFRSQAENQIPVREPST